MKFVAFKLNAVFIVLTIFSLGFLNAYCLNTDDVENIGYVEEKEDTSTITEKRKGKFCFWSMPLSMGL